MKFNFKILACLSHVFVLLFNSTSAAENLAPIIFNINHLNELQKRVALKDPAFMPAALKLLADADGQLDLRPASVMEKTSVPQSRNKHDYMSLGRYWWPDAGKKDGIPYIRRDGIINPEIWLDKYDYAKKQRMTVACKLLSMAYFLTKDERYADQAARHIKVWFINRATSMNPNMNYAQGIPGKIAGRGAGIIESYPFPELFDAVCLLEGSKHWTQKDKNDLSTWVKKYLKWMLTSFNGTQESLAANNHGCWYDFQIVYFALYTHQRSLAKNYLAQRVYPKLSNQFTETGAQPLELLRTKSFFYCTYNLEALFKCALLAERIGEDLWEAKEENPRLRKGLDWLLPYALGEKEWVNNDIEPVNGKLLAHLLLVAARVYQEKKYVQDYQRIMHDEISFDQFPFLDPNFFN